MSVGFAMRKFAPVAALFAAVGLSGCDDINVSFGGADGVPLAEFDMSGTAPSGVALGGGDIVVITTGDTFTIAIDGDEEAHESLRFDLDDGVLSIGRDSDGWDSGEQATVNITMPAPTSLVLGGSGRITADAMSGDPEIIIGGSGEIIASGVAGGDMEVVLGGSGRTQVSGAVDSLELSIGGSGSADMAGLQVGDAEVNIGGSGSAAFASDGNVEANIGGSGTVRVTGSATCEINAFGSGSLICEDAPIVRDEGEEPEDTEGTDPTE